MSLEKKTIPQRLFKTTLALRKPFKNNVCKEKITYQVIAVTLLEIRIVLSFA
jgi:hypothetical protein